MKLKRILAIFGAVVLAGLVLAAFILAIAGAPANILMAVIFSILFLSVLFYAMNLMARVLWPEDKSDDS